MDDLFIKLKDFPEYVNRLGIEDWNPIFELIPEIEATTNFGEESGMEQIRPGVISFPYYVPAEVVRKFEERAYRLKIVIDFDWGNWDEGRKLAFGGNEDLEKIDLITACKLITAIIRNDRFCDGALISSFESGLMPTLIKRIRDIITES